MSNYNRKKFKNFDFVLFFTVIILCIYGLVVINSATLSTGRNTSYLKSQGAAIILGLVAIGILVIMDYKILGSLYLPIYIVSNLLLVATLIWGTGAETWGSDSWLSVGPITFQPSEFVKVGLIISLSKYIDMHKETLNQPFTLIKILAFAGFPVLLILLQPDAGTAMVFIFFIAFMLFIAGLDWKYIGPAIALGLISLPILWFNLDQYQKDRIFDFLDPERSATGTGYQAIQGKIAIGSGKIFGRGLYQGVQTQYNFIPIKESDFIFAVLVEELGFLGGIALIILYTIMLYRLIQIARESTDLFGSLMVVGFTAMFIFHIWENIGMNIGLMPITGIPLPFMSHGGSFLLISMVCIGISLSVHMHKDGLNF